MVPLNGVRDCSRVLWPLRPVTEDLLYCSASKLCTEKVSKSDYSLWKASLACQWWWDQVHGLLLRCKVAFFSQRCWMCPVICGLLSLEQLCCACPFKRTDCTSAHWWMRRSNIRQNIDSLCQDPWSSSVIWREVVWRWACCWRGTPTELRSSGALVSKMTQVCVNGDQFVDVAQCCT